MSTEIPKWLVPVGVVALLWNLLGCAAYLADVMLTPEDIAQMPAATQAAYAARPGWAVAATAIAVWAGAAGSLGLILRKAWAVPLLGASFIGVIAQDLGLFVLTDSGRQAGTIAFVLQSLVLVVAICLLLLGRRAKSAGWLG